jgi:hypothetical protein
VVVSCLSAWLALMSHVHLMGKLGDAQFPSIINTPAWGVDLPAVEGVGGDAGGKGG